MSCCSRTLICSNVKRFFTCLTETSKSKSRSGPEHKWTLVGTSADKSQLEVSGQLKYRDQRSWGFTDWLSGWLIFSPSQSTFPSYITHVILHYFPCIINFMFNLFNCFKTFIFKFICRWWISVSSNLRCLNVAVHSLNKKIECFKLSKLV